MTAAIAIEDASNETSPLPPPPPLMPSLPARLRTAFGAMKILFRDPNRLDQVLVMAAAMNAKMVQRAVLRLEGTEEGRRMFDEQPRIDRAHVDFEALRKLPDDTLGREYVRFLDTNNIGPEPFEQLPSHINPRAAYVMLRMRQTHDIWHVLTGYKPDVHGEIMLQAFTYAQTGAPSAFVIVFGGMLREGLLFQKRAREEVRHAIARGKATKRLAPFRWEDHWSTPVRDLRKLLECPPPPPPLLQNVQNTLEAV